MSQAARASAAPAIEADGGRLALNYVVEPDLKA
jgi:hypothetical protein